MARSAAERSPLTVPDQKLFKLAIIIHGMA